VPEIDTANTDEAVLPGLSYRVQVWHDGLHKIPPGAVDISDPADLEPGSGPHLRARFDYLRVSGESIEDALARVQAHHLERYGYLGGRVDVTLLGYNIDDQPVPTPRVLVDLAERPAGGWEWSVAFYGAEDEAVRWRTDSRGQGLWRWTGTDWVQTHGHLQWEIDAANPAAWLMRRWGLADWRAQAAAQAADDDLIPADKVLALLRKLGRPITAATLRNYRSKPPQGWPQPVKYVGRTPLWSQRAVAAYATQ
jgi:hypothetical protein